MVSEFGTSPLPGQPLERLQLERRRRVRPVRGCAGAPAATFNSEYAQTNIQGQYHNEIVATAEREIMEDMTVRIDYQHRWLGNIIEDGYGPGFAERRPRQPG